MFIKFKYSNNLALPYTKLILQAMSYLFACVVSASLQIIEECNTQVGKMKQMEELIQINKTLEFDKLKVNTTAFQKARDIQHKASLGCCIRAPHSTTRLHQTYRARYYQRYYIVLTQDNIMCYHGSKGEHKCAFGLQLDTHVGYQLSVLQVQIDCLRQHPKMQNIDLVCCIFFVLCLLCISFMCTAVFCF